MSPTLTFDDAAAFPPDASRGLAAAGLTAHGSEFLAFRLGGECIGVDIRRVQEIRAFEAPARVADAPAGVLGVLRLHGARVPVVDLRVHLRLPDCRYNADTVTLVLAVAGRGVGLVVDGVSDVVTVAPQQLRPAADATGPLDPRFVLAVGALPRHTLTLVDIDALLADPALGLA